MKVLNILPILISLSSFAQIGISSKPFFDESVLESCRTGNLQNYGSVEECEDALSKQMFKIHPNAAVHIDEGNQVVKFPHVKLKGISDQETVVNPQIGLMVYNTNDAVSPRRGFCYWDGMKWINYEDTKAVVASEVSIDEISLNMLGYNPEGSHSNADKAFTINRNGRSITFTPQGCVQFSGNNHYYCGFTTNIPLDWSDAFVGAKSTKGYLVTITSKKEWDFIVKNFYKNENSLNNKNFRSLIDDARRVWIGYNKVKPIGYHQQFTWVTGEVSEVDWLTGKRFSGFAPYEPNDSQGEEGCSHIHYVNDAVVNGDLTKLSWNDTPCNLATHPNNYAGMAPKFVIIEFNQ